MKTDVIRKKFLDFFQSKKHTIVESDSLVPKNDPTVLFTTAGMQQFKRQFLGHIEGYTRAATSQKCLRTDDLEEVGKTAFHHTFFEMLGNFSFGDYFKKEAIEWGWEFLTKELDIPKEKLWVSVYKDDTEAYDIWIKDIKVDKKKIVKLGDKSNFWPSNAKENGPNGPCGPCSEIFYDYGINKNCQSKVCDPDCNCGRFAEIWNLVFTQYNRLDGGKLEPLPSKNIDTGMGLERLAAVVQKKKTNFETDLFEPILKAIDANITIKNARGRYVTADHIRAIVIGISDGVVPSNEGRGYVMKKLIIDITDIALQAGNDKPVIHTLVASVVETLGKPYPQIKKNAKNIANIIESVEKAYIKVRKERLPEFKSSIFEVKTLPETEQSLIIGEKMFTYRDTYGLTFPTMVSTMSTVGIAASVQVKAKSEYEKYMQKQQEQSRASSKMTGDVFTGTDLKLDTEKTKFFGYEKLEIESKILKLFVDNNESKTASKGDSVKVILDQTPFYAESGGQIGDAGTLTTKNARIKITDTQKTDDIFIHSGEVAAGNIKAGDKVIAQVDQVRRLSIMRNHTATHLLQAALRDILGEHIAQQGSLVSEERLRFDFTQPKGITIAELAQIEKQVNDQIQACMSVTKEEMSIEKARKSKALSFFAEKYGDKVRVVSIGDVSKEFCGGTHLDYTGQIGFFKIINESAVAQGIRRIEAKTGSFALAYAENQDKQLHEIAQVLKSSPNELATAVRSQSNRIKQLEKDLEKYRFDSIKTSLDKVIEEAETVKTTKLLSYCFDDVDMNILRKICDLLKQKLKSSIIVLGAKSNDSASILVSVSDDLVKKGIKANTLIQNIAPLINGNGGGREQLAQAGSKETSKVNDAIKLANKIVKETINL